MQNSGKSFGEIEIDEFFESQLTVTELHIVTGAGLFGDFNPLNVSDQFCEKTRFGKRILHGPLTSALMSAPVGMYFAGKVPKPTIQAGIALLSGTYINHDGVSVALTEGKIMLVELKE